MFNLHSFTELVRTLFPDSPPSSSSANSMFNCMGSTQSSVAGFSTGSMEHDCEMASSSAPSISGTSMTSTTMLSEGPLVDPLVKGEDLPLAPKSVGASCSKQGVEETREDLGHRLRMVCEKLTERKGLQTDSNGFRSADMFAFIYISENGEELSLRPFETGAGSEKPSTSTEGNSFQRNEKMDYDFLREAVTRLTEDPVRLNDLISILNVSENGYPDHDSRISPLEALFRAMMESCQFRLDFNDAHYWWKSLEALRNFTGTRNSPNTYETLLWSIGRDVRTNMIRHARINEQNEKWLRALNVSQNQQQNVLRKLKIERNALRLKMWYISDVRHSSTYEDALHVTRALRAMANPQRLKQPGSITNWARHRLRSSSGHDRSEVQVLEALCAQKDYGGPTKLADEQIELTSRWLTRNSIENFCKGEERIHRFCFEIHKCVNKLGGANLLDSPVLWSSRLFEREKLAFDKHEFTGLGDGGSNTAANPWSRGSIPSPLGYNPALVPTTFQSLRSHDITNNISRLWNSPRIESHDTAETDLAGLSRVQELFPVRPPWPDNSSAVSPITTQSIALLGDNMVCTKSFGEDSKAKKRAFMLQIQQDLSSLLLSDLGYIIWAQGSETDAWVNVDLPELSLTSITQLPTEPQPNSDCTKDEGGPQPDRMDHSASQGSTESDGSRLTRRCSTTIARSPHTPPVGGKQLGSGIYDPYPGTAFPYLEAYKRLLQKFSASPDPHVKLQMLYELEMLVLNSIQQHSVSEHLKDSTLAESNMLSSTNTHLTARTMRVPRTKATIPEEVVANCFERRAGTLKSRSPNRIPSPKGASFSAAEIETPDTNGIVNTLLAMFRDSKLRPQSLFRDLQLIAAFVPSKILDQTPKGKAFWDAGLAALALKEDLCESMIDRANQITTYHISSNKTSTPDRSTPHHLANTKLKDAAELWIITAREGSPTAARELGLFYLAHPELLRRVTLPLSKSKDVFKSVVSRDRSGNESGALDPLTFAVVFHWMELAANGGDKDAKDFLRGNGELSAVM